MSRRTMIRVAGAAAVAAGGLTWAASSPAEAASPVPGSGGIPDGPSTWGWNPSDLLAFDPATSPWARHLRCLVPRASRIDHFAATQAHPDLSPSTRLSTLTIDDIGSIYEARNQSIGSEPYVYTQRYWPYIDVWGTWHGQVLPSVSDEVLTTPGAPGRDYGVIDIPNPGWTEAAHKNGARAIGGWFWPRSTTNFDEFLVQREDGSFPVADKIIEIKQYFGFDGLFINQEASITTAQVEKLFAMFRYLRSQDADFHLQYYDAVVWNTGQLRYQNQLNATNVGALGTPDDRAVDSVFVNYAWPYVDPTGAKSVVTAEKAGFVATEVAYFGVEMQKGGFNPEEDFGALAGPGKEPTTSVALFVDDAWWGTKAADGTTHTVEGRRTCRDLERKMWSGPQGDPARSGRLDERKPPYRTNILNHRVWDGIAHWIVERSPYGALPIHTTCNIGVGSAFRVAGAVVSDTGWNNQGIADPSLTWQYWTEGGDLVVDLDETQAWEGGHSLSVHGAGVLHCFKTDLVLGRAARVAVRTAGTLAVEVGVTMRDHPGQIDWRRLRPRDRTGEWTELVATLPARPHERVARISLRVSGSGNIGAITIADLNAWQRGPGSVRSLVIVDEGPTSGQTGRENVSLTWRLGDDAVAYDVLQIGNDRDRWLGRVQRDAFFAIGVDLSAGRRFAVVPISAIGTRGPASITSL